MIGFGWGLVGFDLRSWIGFCSITRVIRVMVGMSVASRIYTPTYNSGSHIILLYFFGTRFLLTGCTSESTGAREVKVTFLDTCSLFMYMFCKNYTSDRGILNGWRFVSFETKH